MIGTCRPCATDGLGLLDGKLTADRREGASCVSDDALAHARFGHHKISHPIGASAPIVVADDACLDEILLLVSSVVVDAEARGGRLGVNAYRLFLVAHRWMRRIGLAPKEQKRQGATLIRRTKMPDVLGVGERREWAGFRGRRTGVVPLVPSPGNWHRG